MPKAESCVYAGRVISIESALEIRDRGEKTAFTCTECGSPVRAHKEGTTGQGAHFEHFERNLDCSKSGE